jgi:hypothetical protein
MKTISDKKTILKSFQKLPWIGPRFAEELWSMELRSLDDIAQSDPTDLYNKMCSTQKTKSHKNMLYLFRCIVYAAKTPNPDPLLLKWWNWKDSSRKSTS